MSLDLSKQIAGMQIKLVPIDELIPYAQNSRSHSPEQIDLISKSIRENGWTNPMLIADGGILAGHGRLQAAIKIGLRQVPCIDLSHLSEQQRRVYIIADNRLPELAGWDVEMLKLEVVDLRADGFDFNEIGFTDADLAQLLGPLDDPEKPDADPEAVPAIPIDPVSRLGDVWLCGPHRVCCGSSRELHHWDELMCGEKADAVWTDPPYNVDLERKNKLMDGVDGGRRSRNGTIANDKMGDEAFGDFLRDCFANVFVMLKAGSPIYVAHPDLEAHTFRTEFMAAGFHFSSNLIWRKDKHVLGMADYQSMHEPIIYGWKPGTRHRWYGGRKLKSVVEYGDSGPIRQLPDGRWSISVGDNVLIVDGNATIEEVPGTVLFHPKPARSDLHPSTKPVGLIEKMLGASARAGDIVVDAFGGSGSTLIACDQLGMSARVMELDPAFVDVIVRRWEHFTGRRAAHAVTGEMFPAEDGEEPAPPAAITLPEPAAPAVVPF